MYDIFTHEIDDYAYKHPDFIAVFAAGNDGKQCMWFICLSVCLMS